MDNCDLEKLSLNDVCLCPSFKPHLTLYTATVPSHIGEVTLEVLTSDCGASYIIVSMTTCVEYNIFNVFLRVQS